MTFDRPPRTRDLLPDNAARGRSWADFGVTELMEHLVATHHAYVVAELPRLLELGAKLRANNGDEARLGTVIALLESLDAELGPHLLTEEDVLFPWCRRLDAGEPVGDWVAERMRCMHRQHVDTAGVLDVLRDLTANFAVPAGASPEHRAFMTGVAGFEADLRLHIHKEEEVLFPKVLAQVEAAAESS